jgi:hypothetical protein
MDGALIVCSHQVDVGDDGQNLVGVVIDMTDGVAVRDDLGVEFSVVAAMTLTVVFWERCVGRKTRNSRSGELPCPAKWRRTRL